MLHELIALIWEKEIILYQWKDANIIKLYKRKGDQAVCTNSRDIALLSTASKVLAKVLCKRLITHIVERIVTETQCGFRPDHSTADMIFVARQFFENSREQHRDMCVAFVDLSKAFDTVPRGMLWRVLSKVGCPPKFVNLVRQFHDGMEASVLIDCQHSENFEVTVGVKHCCVLAPILFITYLTGVSYLLKEKMERQWSIGRPNIFLRPTV